MNQFLVFQVLVLLELLSISPTSSSSLDEYGRESIETRVNQLLSQMTLTEKIYQLTSWEGNLPATYEYGLGQIKSSGSDPASVISYRNSEQTKVVNGSRLNIPAAFRQETLHSSVDGDTVFPMPIAQGISLILHQSYPFLPILNIPAPSKYYISQTQPPILFLHGQITFKSHMYCTCAHM